MPSATAELEKRINRKKIPNPTNPRNPGWREMGGACGLVEVARNRWLLKAGHDVGVDIIILFLLGPPRVHRLVVPRFKFPEYQRACELEWGEYPRQSKYDRVLPDLFGSDTRNLLPWPRGAAIF